MTRLFELLMVAIVPTLVGLFSPPLDLVDDDDRQAGDVSEVEPANGIDAPTQMDDGDTA